MSIEAMKLALEALNSFPARHLTPFIVKARQDLRQAIEQAEQAQPVAWMFQHDETGRTMCVDAQQVEWGFEKSNPRLKRIAPLYTAPPPRKPLTDEQEYKAIGTAGVDLLELAKQWADNEIHVYQFDNEARKIIKAVLRRAHGIKGGA